MFVFGYAHLVFILVAAALSTVWLVFRSFRSDRKLMVAIRRRNRRRATLRALRRTVLRDPSALPSVLEEIRREAILLASFADQASLSEDVLRTLKKADGRYGLLVDAGLAPKILELPSRLVVPLLDFCARSQRLQAFGLIISAGDEIWHAFYGFGAPAKASHLSDLADRQRHERATRDATSVLRCSARAAARAENGFRFMAEVLNETLTSRRLLLSELFDAVVAEWLRSGTADALPRHVSLIHQIGVRQATSWLGYPPDLADLVLDHGDERASCDVLQSLAKTLNLHTNRMDGPRFQRILNLVERGSLRAGRSNYPCAVESLCSLLFLSHAPMAHLHDDLHDTYHKKHGIDLALVDSMAMRALTAFPRSSLASALPAVIRNLEREIVADQQSSDVHESYVRMTDYQRNRLVLQWLRDH